MMADKYFDKAKRRIIGRSYNWIQTFDPIDYIGNRPMIMKLYEEKQLAIALNLDLEAKIEDATKKIRKLELENQRISSLANIGKKQAFTNFSISLLATILIGIGVNIATSQPNNWAGWVMITSAIILEVITFILVYNQSD